LSADLAEALLEFDGASADEYGSTFLWELDRIVEDNLDARSSMDDEHSTVDRAEVCFFADGGDGSWFGFVPKREARGLHDIYVSGPAEGSWTWVAPDLERFVRGWLSGDITI
jgi:hypothetical protein